MKTQTATTKEVKVLARIQFKANGIVLYKVLSSDGKTIYGVTVVNGKATGCTCPSYKPCKHMKGIEAKEQQRSEVLTPDVEIESERADYLAQVGQTTEDTIAHIEADMRASQAATFAALMEKYDYRQQASPAATPVVEVPASVAQTEAIHDGYYTVSFDGEHRTFRLRTNDADASFAPGKQVISFLSGSNNEADYTGFGFVSLGQLLTWKRFRYGYEHIQEAARFLLDGDHAEAGKFYAQESGCCYVCNRTLTTPESIAAGIGPVCASKVGVAIATPDLVKSPELVNAFLNEYHKDLDAAYSRDPRIEMSQHDAERTAYLNYSLSLEGF